MPPGINVNYGGYFLENSKKKLAYVRITKHYPGIFTENRFPEKFDLEKFSTK